MRSLCQCCAEGKELVTHAYTVVSQILRRWTRHLLATSTMAKLMYTPAAVLETHTHRLLQAVLMAIPLMAPNPESSLLSLNLPECLRQHFHRELYLWRRLRNCLIVLLSCGFPFHSVFVVSRHRLPGYVPLS